MSYRDVDPEAANTELGANAKLIPLDVRTPPEHDRYRVRGAQLLPVQELADRVGELDSSQPYLVICEHGIRSVAACQILEQAGFTDLRNLAGGMARWIDAGLPCER